MESSEFRRHCPSPRLSSSRASRHYSCRASRHYFRRRRSARLRSGPASLRAPPTVARRWVDASWDDEGKGGFLWCEEGRCRSLRELQRRSDISEAAVTPHPAPCILSGGAHKSASTTGLRVGVNRRCSAGGGCLLHLSSSQSKSRERLVPTSFLMVLEHEDVRDHEEVD